MQKEVKDRLKGLLRFAGSGLAILGALFIVNRFAAYRESLANAAVPTTVWVRLAVLVLFYGGLETVLGLAWHSLLAGYGLDVSKRWTLSAYGISQINKYLPGNVFHLAGRQALAMGAGLPGGAVAKTAVWELSLLALAGAVVGSAVLPLHYFSSAALAVITVLVSGGLVVVVLFMINRRYWVGSFMIYCLFHLGTALLFFLLVNPLVPREVCVMLVPVYIASWLAGLVTPGAPAGLGVREAVLFWFMRSRLPVETVLLIVALGRMMTLLGDVVFFITGVTLRFLEKRSR